MTDNALKIIKDELERMFDQINKLQDCAYEPIDDDYDSFRNLTKALSVAAEALESISQAIHSNNYKYREATDSLTTIANILSGGKDGK